MAAATMPNASWVALARWRRPARSPSCWRRSPSRWHAASETVAIPTIGIGASAACDGQVLVIDDMLGMFQGFQPKFVKRYAELGRDARSAEHPSALPSLMPI